MDKVWIEKLAIRELCSRYCQTIDSQDSDGWARCFLRDGAFEFDGHVARGYAELRSYAALREYAEARTRVLRAQPLLRGRGRPSDRACDDGRFDRDTLRLQHHGAGRLP